MDNNDFNNGNEFDRDGHTYYSAPQEDFQDAASLKRAENSDKYANVSMICGIIAIVSYFVCCFLFGLPPIVLAIVSLVYAVKSKKNSETNSFTGKSVAGLVLSIISLVLVALMIMSLVFSVIMIMNDPEALEEFQKAYEEAYNQGVYYGS